MSLVSVMLLSKLNILPFRHGESAEAEKIALQGLNFTPLESPAIPA